MFCSRVIQQVLSLRFHNILPKFWGHFQDQAKRN